MSLKTKLIGSMTCILITCLLVTGYGFYGSKKMSSSATNIHTITFPKLDKSNTLATIVEETRQILLEAIEEASVESLDDLPEKVLKFHQTVTMILIIKDDKDIDAINGMYIHYVELGEKVVRAYLNTGMETIYDDIQQVTTLTNKLNEMITAYRKKNYTIFSTSTSDIKQKAHTFQVIFLVFGVMLVFVVLGIMLIVNSTVKEIKKLENDAKALAAGELDTPIEVNRTDELGTLQKSFEDMRISLVKHIKRLDYMAMHDTLTLLPNRRAFINQLETQIARAKRHKELFAVLYLELGKFKEMNDSYGHEVGDKLLLSVSKRLRSIIRKGDILSRMTGETSLAEENDFIARVGGDEFTIILHNIKQPEDAGKIANKINAAFTELFHIFQYEIQIPVSIGVSIYPSDGKYVDELIRNSDMAMYEAKNYGPNSYMIFNSELNEKAKRILDLEEELKYAIKKNEFTLFYQPKIDKSRTIKGVEALIRWNNGKRGFIPPYEFIPILEANRQIIDVGVWIFRTVCMQIKKWEHLLHSNFKVAVNLSPHQFLQKDFLQMIISTLREYSVRPEQLEIEITESAAMSDVEKTIDVLSNFRDMGLKIAIDDFGTGFSSLNYLVKFPIDVLKIDKSFIDQVNKDEHSNMLLLSIMNIAKKLELEIVAEGVETKEQFDFLFAQGCDLVQGYLFSEPLSAEDLEKKYFS